MNDRKYLLNNPGENRKVKRCSARPEVAPYLMKPGARRPRRAGSRIIHLPMMWFSPLLKSNRNLLILPFFCILFLVGCLDGESSQRELARKIRVNASMLNELSEDLLYTYRQVRNSKFVKLSPLRDKIENLEKIIPVLRDQTNSAEKSSDRRIAKLWKLEEDYFNFFQKEILKRYFDTQKFLETPGLNYLDRNKGLDPILVEIIRHQEILKERKKILEKEITTLFPQENNSTEKKEN